VFDTEQMSTKILLTIMTLAPSTNVVYPDEVFIVVEGIFLCASRMKIEGHRIYSWEVPYINFL
jgi:hypothetical protein